jgi:hypothetical protein
MNITDTGLEQKLEKIRNEGALYIANMNKMVDEGLKEIEELKTSTGAIVAIAKEANEYTDVHAECEHGVMALDCCQDCEEANEMYQGDTTQEQMLNLTLRAIEKLAKAKLKNINISLNTSFKEDGLRFHITVSDKKNDNFTFWFYPFWSFEKNYTSLAKILNEIDKDDYQLLKELKKELRQLYEVPPYIYSYAHFYILMLIQDP